VVKAGKRRDALAWQTYIKKAVQDWGPGWQRALEGQNNELVTGYAEEEGFTWCTGKTSVDLRNGPVQTFNLTGGELG
jgi:hypothetical protein